MTFVIDTSATRWAVALVDGDGSRTLIESTDRPDLAGIFRAIEKPTRIAVATGPGSFTGLRVGVSFALGLAIGLRIPIAPLPSLDLQRARSTVPATAVLEAGRGRVYYQLPGSTPMLGELADIPVGYPLVGNVAPKTEDALVAARHRFVPAEEQRDFAEAARKLLETAREVPYRSLEVEYMQSLVAKR
jgi:tRNA threonylcarbamoyl adenosine modification protein YeaZ